VLVTLRVFDVLGRELRILINSPQDAGIYTLAFDGSNLPSGIYSYTLSAGDFEETKVMLLIK
jgi:hypothetical protein